MRHFETHCHCSEFSLDSKRKLEELLREADAKQLAAICLTDHYDKDGVNGKMEREVSAYGAKPAEGEWIFDVEAYFAKLLPLKQARMAHAEKTQLLIGVELGYTAYLEAHYRRLLADWPFDQVIASIHFMNDIDLYFAPEFYEQDKSQAYGQWMQSLLALAESDMSYDVLGHFDYVIRYANYADNRLRYDDFPDEFDAMLKALAERERALEINTRYRFKLLRDGAADPGFIDPKIIRRFLDLGGELISVSSDSHENGTLGYLFDESCRSLNELGCRRICYFKARRPHYIDLN